ncbi:hypothetical protein Tco_0401046 [Tanacetum coccineum]
MASGGSDWDAEYALSKLLQMGEAFSLARIAEASFTDLQLWELLRSNPTTLGEAFFLACITGARFKDQQGNNVFDATSSDQPATGLEANKIVNDGDDEKLAQVVPYPDTTPNKVVSERSLVKLSGKAEFSFL